MIYSHSRLSTFEQCPYKFKLRYIDKIKREEAESVEAFVGKRVHETLQKLYDDMLLTKENTLGDLFTYYDKIWRENWNDAIAIVRKKYTKDDYYKFGKKCVENYYNRYKPFNQSLTVGTEVPVTFCLDDEGKYAITGFIDRVAHVNGRFEAHDYKTSSSLPTQEKVDQDRQLSFYQMAIQKMWPEAKEVDLIWHYLAFDVRMTSQRNNSDLEKIKQATIELINTIEMAKIYPARESALCKWCEYPDICPKRKHFYCIENIGVNGYYKDKGVELVNKYVQLALERTKLEEKINVVRMQLVDYARKESLEIIKGNEHKARVRIASRLKFPSKDTLERAALEELLRSSGKWSEVSNLNIMLLNKMCRLQNWPEELLVQVREFAQEEEMVSVCVSELEEYEE